MSASGKRIILSGASSGIGRALAIEYARHNAKLVLTARRGDLLEEVASEVRRAGGQAVTIVDDITSVGIAERLVRAADDSYGGLDLVIMNAGMGGRTFPSELTAEAVERMMEVNFFSAARMVAHVLPRMRAERRGQLVAVSSLAGLRGLPGSAAYSSSKAALSTFMESLRIDLRGSGVVITTISPGFVRTSINASNEFSMPFMIEADDAARRILSAIERGAADYGFPKPTSLAMRIGRVLPRWLFERITTAVRPPVE
jgi:short-subunit dehydrogenase